MHAKTGYESVDAILTKYLSRAPRKVRFKQSFGMHRNKSQQITQTNIDCITNK